MNKKFLFIIFILSFMIIPFNSVKAEEITLPYNFSYGSTRVFTVDFITSTNTVKISATLNGTYTERLLPITKKYFLVQTQGSYISVWQSDNIMTITNNYNDFWNVNNVEIVKTINIASTFNDFATPSSGNALYYNYISSYVKQFANFDLKTNTGVLKLNQNILLKPIITFTKTNDMIIDLNVVRAKLNIKFSIYDTNKYIYEYASTNQGIEDFYDISSNDEYDINNGFDIYTNVNDSFVVRILDKTTNELVQTATYTISNIFEILPYVKISEIKNDYCKITESGIEKIICKELKIDIVLANLLNYQPYYSSDGGTTFEPFFEDTIREIYYANADVVVKILNKTTNEFIDSSSYTITSIVQASTTLPYIKFNYEFVKGKSLLDDSYSSLKAIIYNFDFNLYDIYYKKGNSDFELDTSNFKNLSYLIYEKKMRFIEDTTVIFKIVDKQGNYINSFSYQINYSVKLEENNYFLKLIKPVKDKFPIFEQMVNIYDLYSSYEFTEEVPNLPKIDTSFIGVEKQYEIIDLSFYSQYRELIFNYIKLSVGLYTFFKVIRNVKSSF